MAQQIIKNLLQGTAKASKRRTKQLLKAKKQGKKVTDRRMLPGPLEADRTIDGKTYKAKPSKIGKQLDPVQDESNKLEYIKNYGEEGTRGELNFADDKGTYYLNSKGDDNLGYNNLQTKNGNNSKLASRRARDEELMTRPDMDTRDFYKGVTPGMEAHHIQGLDEYAWLFEGLGPDDQIILIGKLEEAGIPVGNNPANRADLPKRVHTEMHNWMRRKGFVGKNRASIAHMSVEDRIEKHLNPLLERKKEVMEHMYGLMMSDNEFHRSYVKEAEPEFAGIAPGSQKQSKG